MKLIRVELKDVPEDCIDDIKAATAVIIDRFYVNRNEKLDPRILLASNTTKDNFRVINNMPKKYYPDPDLDCEEFV